MSQLVACESAAEKSDASEMGSADDRAVWTGRVLYVVTALCAAAVAVAAVATWAGTERGTAGESAAARRAPTAAEFLQGDALTVAAPRSLSAAEFLQSDALTASMTEQWLRSSPHCAGSASRSSPGCNATEMTPRVQAAVRAKANQHADTELMQFMSRTTMSEQAMQAALSSVAHLSDPRVARVTGDIRRALSNESSPGSHVERLFGVLDSHAEDMGALRDGIFPTLPYLTDPEFIQNLIQRLVPSGVVTFREHAAPDHPWEKEFRMSVPTRGRRLGENDDIFYHGPMSDKLRFSLENPAPKGGLPPPDNYNIDVFGAIPGVPFLHIILASLHAEGKLTLPYWAKVLYTVEDFFIWAAPLGPLSIIVDASLMFAPRGYRYARPELYEKYAHHLSGPYAPFLSPDQTSLGDHQED